MIVRSSMARMVVMMQMFRGSEFGQVQQGDPVRPGMAFMQVVDSNSMIVNATINQVDVEKDPRRRQSQHSFRCLP